MKIIPMEGRQEKAAPGEGKIPRKRHSKSHDATINFNTFDSIRHHQKALLFDESYGRFNYHRNEYYRYNNNGKWKLISRSDLEAKIMRYLQAHNDAKATSHSCKEIRANLEAICLVDSDFELPGFPEQTQAREFFNFKNGLVPVDGLISGNPKLVEHTPEYFSLNQFSYTYQPDATCPIWEKTVRKILSSKDSRQLFQEWCGYNLVRDTTQHKFVIMVGKGKNGKTVCVIVLRCLLGAANVSSVGLEQFSATRTFPLAAMVGKHANIVEEISEMDKVAEGILKQLVSGGTITVERKFGQPFEAKMTARLTFATNVLPRFRDRSDGLWRRLILLPFNVQIPEHKQNKNLVSETWWQESGELPGIFNWAIRGLVRLKKRGYFKIPAESNAALQEYKLDSNPSKAFLTDHCEGMLGAHVSSTEVYRAYSTWAKMNGYYSLSAKRFSDELKSTFPGVSLSTNVLRLEGGQRARVWEGLAWCDGEAPWFG